MRYKNNKFYIENVSVNSICKLTNTPTYIYSYKKIKENILGFKKQFKSIDPLTCFSVKSNKSLAPNFFANLSLSLFFFGTFMVLGQMLFQWVN